MTHKLTCQLLPDSYDVEVANGLLCKRELLKLTLERLGSRIALITDETIAPLHGSGLYTLLAASGLKISLFTIPSGEAYKSRHMKELLENQLFEQGFGRDTCIIAMGGGVVTDLAGYVAATYCRGVSLVIIPTSLLGMVDASIGGKTGVNTPYGKNLIGCIYQPKKVLIDPSVLSTLPLSEVKNGIVEVIKHGIIGDENLFQFLDKNAEALLHKDPDLLEKMILESCRVKIEIMEQDEKEEGIRRLLNCGHTIGHALEKVTDYAISHGEAVAIGLIVEARLAHLMGHLKQASFQHIQKVVKKYGLPLKIPSGVSLPAICEAMKLDKKAVKGTPRFVILQEIGSPLEYGGAYCTSVEENILKDCLQWMIDDLCRH